MPEELMKFNPGFKSDEQILSEFVVRKADLGLILDTIRGNSAAPCNQHVLVVGPRGIGKTTLVLRVAAEIRHKDPELGRAWYPIVFSEESYPVSTPGEFWLEAIFHVAEQRPNDEGWRSIYEELRDEKDEVRLRERAIARLTDLADGEGKRLLLIVENLQMLLGDQLSDDDAWVLRETLQNEPRIMLLGTATTRFWEMMDVNKAFYEAFKVLDLRPLTTTECQELWEAVSGQPVPAQRVRPVQILTGGNPRLLTVIATFAARSSLRELMNDLTRLVDDHTDYFKSHLDDLPAMERKVFVALCDIWDPAPAREVARVARTDVNKASAQLQRLEKRGAVVAEMHRSRKLYRVAERLYNIYYLMRRRSDSATRVRALVRFMVSFYETAQLLRAAGYIARESVWVTPNETADHLAWMESLLQSVDEAMEGRLRDAMIGEMQGEIHAAHDEALAAWKSAIGNGDPESVRDAEAKLRRIVSTWPNVPDMALRLAYMLAAVGDARQREEASRLYDDLRLLDLDDSPLDLMLRSLIACQLGKAALAERDVSRLLAERYRLASTWPGGERALDHVAFQVMLSLDDRGNAIAFTEDYLRRMNRSALSLNNAAWSAHKRWGNLFENQTLEWAREAVSKEAGNPAYVHTLASILASQAKWPESMALLPSMLHDAKETRRCVPDFSDLLVQLAAAGHAREALRCLEESPSLAVLEPLALALRLDLGDRVTVAPEVLEVAQDVLRQIREKRAEIERQQDVGAE